MSTIDRKPDLSRLQIKEESASSSSGREIRSSSLLKLTLGVVGGLVVGYLLLSKDESPPKLLSGNEGVNKNSANSVVSNSSASTSEGSVLEATGYVVAQRKASVSSKATGRLKELRVAEGSTVKANDIIGFLESDDVQAIVRESEASLSAAEARIRSAEAEVKDARAQYNRVKNLLATKVVSEADFDSAQARIDKAVADLSLSQANLEVARARLDKAKVDLEYTNIRAPFDGTVLTKDADVGEIVAPFGSSTSARAALVTLADMSSLEVEADVNESNLAQIFVGQLCDITLDSYPEKQYQGTVSSIVPTVDRAKATVQVKIRFEKLDPRVIPEMSARVTFKLQESNPN